MLILIILLFLAHWIITAFMTLYVFFTPSPKYDKYYLLFIAIVILNWLIFNDCLISKWEKDILQVPKDKPYHNPSMQFYLENSYVTLLFSVFIFTLILYNMYVTMFRVGVPIQIIILIIASFALYVGYYRYQEFLYIKNKNNQ